MKDQIAVKQLSVSTKLQLLFVSSAKLQMVRMENITPVRYGTVFVNMLVPVDGLIVAGIRVL